MKNVITAVALLALSILPVNARTASSRMDGDKPKIIIADKIEQNPTRSPVDYDVDLSVESLNNTLSIYLLCSLATYQMPVSL